MENEKRQRRRLGVRRLRVGRGAKRRGSQGEERGREDWGGGQRQRREMGSGLISAIVG